ncbi:MAG: hypothetical protein ABI146_08195 [Nitrobacter sp.]|jgi:uncharacterized protein HemX
MANERNPKDPYARDPADTDVQQPTPTPAAGSAGGGRMALFAVAIVVVLGALFYGLKGTPGPTETSLTTPQSTNESTAQNNATKPPVAPGVRDVTPSNTQRGVTTGAAPAPAK